ncbi:regulatory protein [Clostridium acetobutylicum]|nr:regulatory protein [Clostridium acetobutylicum]
MQTLKCKKCGKTLLEAEGQANIIKVCPKCKNRNEFHIKESKKFEDKIIKK